MTDSNGGDPTGGDTTGDDTRVGETYNPWSVVHLVFDHLAEEGLHPVLGAPGDPRPAAAELLRMLGVEPAPEGNRQVTQDIRDHLATLRTTVLGER